MTISYPLTLPGGCVLPKRLTHGADSKVGLSMSPYTFSQQTYAHQGQRWDMALALPPMSRAQAELWVGVLNALNGVEGTFLMAPPGYTTAQGTWSGQSPLVNGASQTGNTLAIDGLSAGSTALAGDYLSLGTGSSTHLHKVTQAGTANGSGQVTLDIWPRLRVSPADNATVTIASPKGQWRLADNRREWDIESAMIHGLAFRVIEAISD
jgi:hypothetical protein